MRTAPRAGWRSGLGAAVAVVAGQPASWLVGALGFICRGGIFLLALPIVVVPSPIQVRLLLGESVGSGGLTAGFFAGLAPLLGVAGLVGALALALVAHAELVAFERLVADPESIDQREGREPRSLSASERWHLTASLFAVQVAAAVALFAAALPLAGAAYEVTVGELIRPSEGDGSLYSRVLAGVREPLLVLFAALVVIDIVSAVASRALLVRTFGLGRRPERGPVRALAEALARAIREPLRTIGTALVAWVTSAIVLLPAIWALAVAADTARGAFLSSRAADPQMAPWLIVVTAVLVAVWGVTLVLCGFVSALRAALWTSEALR